MWIDKHEYFDCCKKPWNTTDLIRAVASGDGTTLRIYCKQCVRGETVSTPDVYFGKGYINGAVNYEENIADPKTGKPIPFYDKQSKAAAMRQAGVQEAGDRVHGARNEDSLKKRTYI